MEALKSEDFRPVGILHSAAEAKTIAVVHAPGRYNDQMNGPNFAILGFMSARKIQSGIPGLFNILLTSPAKGRRGFTLLELLIVVAVMAILTSLLIMVFGMVRYSAKKLECANNMRQIHLILLSHANDRKGRLMNTAHLGNDFLRFPNAAYVKGPKAEAADELSFLSLNSYLDFKQTDTDAASYEFVRLMRMWACPIYHAKGGNSGEPAGTGYMVSEGNGNSYITGSYAYLAGVSTWTATQKEGCAEVITDRRPDANRLLLADSNIRWSNQIWYISHFRAGEGGVLPIDRARVRKSLDGANQLYGDGHLRYKPASEFMIDAMHDDTPGPAYARNTIDRWYF